MANEIVSLNNITRFKANCDATYSKKMYWHTITCSYNGGYEVKFSIQTTKSTALTKSNLRALTSTPKPVGGYFYDVSNDLTFYLVYITVDTINRLQVSYINDECTWSTTSKIDTTNWTLTDVVEEV